ncbi:MAG: hypothetical protein U1E27_03070 [Kiritimatiellia bacterium]|nr:hypothetical protein [Kiritimatiellia bacterium]
MNERIHPKSGRWAGSLLCALWTFLWGWTHFVSAQDVFFVDRMAVDELTDVGREGGNFYESRRRPLTIQPAQLPIGPLNPGPMNAPAPRTTEEQKRVRAHVDRAMNLLSAGDLSKALIELRDALVFEPDNLFILKRAVLVAAALRDHPRVDAYASRYLRMDPRDLQVLTARIGALIRLSRIGEAQKTIDQALAIDPQQMATQFHLLTLRLLREEPIPDSSFWPRRRLDEIVQLANWLWTDHAELTAMLGTADFSRFCGLVLGQGAGSDLERIGNHLWAVVRKDPPVSPQERLAALDDLIGLGLHGYGIRAARAEALGLLGRKPEALDLWAGILKEFPDHPEALLNYGHFLLRSGSPADAVEPLRACRRMLGSGDAGIVDFVLASALAMSGEIDKSQEIYHELIRKDRARFRQWMEMDVVFQDALQKLPNYQVLLRRLEIPPESE